MKTEDIHRTLFDNSVFPITYLALDGKILQINAVGATNLGGVPGDFVDRIIYEILPDMAEIIKRRIGQIIESGFGAEYEDCAGLSSGKRWFLSNLQPVTDETGKVVAVQIVSQDTTDRRQMERELRESEEKYRRIVENAATPIVYHSLDGTIVLINAAGARNLGGVPSDFIGKPIDEVLPAFAEQLRERIGLLAESKIGITESEDCVELASVDRWFSSNIQPVMNEKGEMVAIQIISLDITERKHSEESLRDLSRRLVEVQENERHHIARELHDQIGQALTGLKYSLEMAVHESTENPKASLTETQLSIDDLLARVRALSLDLRPSMLDDFGLLPALLWHFKRYRTQTGMEVVFQHEGLEERFPSDVETGAYRIIQEALTNVARHAKVDEVTVQIMVDGESLNLQITDSGIGFDPKAKLRSGMSVGLAGMKERTRLLGGQFAVHSAPGHGTKLTAVLPLTAPTREV